MNINWNLKKRLAFIAKIFGVVIVIFILLFLVILPLATQPRTELSPLAQEWHDSGKYIKWTSTLEENTGFGEQTIFTIRARMASLESKNRIPKN